MVKRAVLSRWSGLFAAVLCTGLWACSDDDGGGSNGGRDGGGRGDIATGDGGGDNGGTDGNTLDQNLADNAGDLCDQIGLAENVGLTCDAVDACGQGGRCITFNADDGPMCFQLCVPGQCTDACTGDEQCLTIVDQDQNPIPVFEGGPNAGVCTAPPTGDQGDYAPCGGDAGDCQAGLQCISLQGIDGDPFCSPTCTGPGTDCPSSGALAGTCALGAVANNPDRCAILCPEANIGTTEGCPTDMSCVDTGQSTGICLY